MADHALKGDIMRLHVPALAAVTVAVLVAGGVAASAGGASKSKNTRLTVQVKTKTVTLVDTGPAGASPGDMALEDDTVTRQGQPFGTAQFTCIAHSGNLLNGNAECTGTLYLPNGQIETQGGVTSTNGFIKGAGAVPGGTRRYHGVRGSYTFHATSPTTRVIQFKLIG